MDIEELHQRANKGIDQVNEAIDFYKKVLAEPLPEQIADLGFAASKLVEKLLPSLKKAELQEWNKRAMKIEKINAALSQLETDLIEHFVVSGNAAFATAVFRQVAILEFVAGHALSALKLILDVNVEAYKQLWNAREQVASQALLVAVQFFSGDWDGAWKSLGDAVKILTAIITNVFTAALLEILINSSEAVLLAYSANGFAKTTQPLKALRDKAIEALQNAAFPQGNGRVRRRKRHRQR